MDRCAAPVAITGAVSRTSHAHNLAFAECGLQSLLCGIYPQYNTVELRLSGIIAGICLERYGSILGIKIGNSKWTAANRRLVKVRYAQAISGCILKHMLR